jgi:hypothetical protein
MSKKSKLLLKGLERDRGIPMIFVGSPAPIVKVPHGAVAACVGSLQHAVSAYVPLWYEDQSFVCVDCGIKEVWTATQQKHYCEVLGGDPAGRAVRCLSCRDAAKSRKAEARREVAANTARNIARRRQS